MPPDWTSATYEITTYGKNGANFTFAKRGDAPKIFTNFYLLFGRVETVMQVASGTGIISSSVLMSDDKDEIDWEFSGNNFGAGNGPNDGKVATNYFGQGVEGYYDRGGYSAVASPQTEFHTYVVDWSETAIIWSIDGNVVRTLLAANADNGSHRYPQSPMQVQLSLWDAGDQNQAGGTVYWAGGYTNLSEAPFTMYVKSVSITNYTPGSAYNYTDKSGTRSSIDVIQGNVSSSSSSTVASSTSSPSSTSVLASGGSLTSSTASTSTLSSTSVAPFSAFRTSTDSASLDSSTGTIHSSGPTSTTIGPASSP